MPMLWLYKRAGARSKYASYKGKICMDCMQILAVGAIYCSVIYIENTLFFFGGYSCFSNMQDVKDKKGLFMIRN